MVKELKVEEKFNLFAIFPIGATMQDSGKRKRSNDITYYFYFIFIINNLLHRVWWQTVVATS